MKRKKSYIKYLPPEVLILIFFYLDSKQLSRIARVSKQLKEASEDNHLWLSFISKHLSSNEADLVKIRSAKNQYIYLMSLTKYFKLPNRFEKFIARTLRSKWEIDLQNRQSIIALKKLVQWDSDIFLKKLLNIFQFESKDLHLLMLESLESGSHQCFMLLFEKIKTQDSQFTPNLHLMRRYHFFDSEQIFSSALIGGNRSSLEHLINFFSSQKLMGQITWFAEVMKIIYRNCPSKKLPLIKNHIVDFINKIQFDLNKICLAAVKMSFENGIEFCLAFDVVKYNEEAKRVMMTEAIKCSKSKTVNLLIEHGFSTQIFDQNGNNLLHLLCDRKAYDSKTDNLREIASLLLRNNVRVDHENNYGVTPLDMALQEKNFLISLFKIYLNMNNCLNHRKNDNLDSQFKTTNSSQILQEPILSNKGFFASNQFRNRNISLGELRQIRVEYHSHKNAVQT